jgi:hypothetical protein
MTIKFTVALIAAMLTAVCVQGTASAQSFFYPPIINQPSNVSVASPHLRIPSDAFGAAGNAMRNRHAIPQATAPATPTEQLFPTFPSSNGG